MGYIRCGTGGAGGEEIIPIESGILLRLDAKGTGGTSAFKMTDYSVKGCMSDAFTAGENNTFIAQKNMNVIFKMHSSGGYETKWAIYKNDVKIYETPSFVNYFTLIETEIFNLSINDSIYVTTWHSNSAAAHINYVDVIEISKKNESINKENIYFSTLSNSVTSWRTPSNYTLASTGINEIGYPIYICNKYLQKISDSECLVLNNVNVKLKGISKNLYTTKWKMTVNNVVVYESSEYVAYEIPIESNLIELKSGDIISISVIHSSSASSGSAYEISRLELIK